jgi:hypothetical protein
VGAGALSTRPGNAMMRLREGTGGKFGNLILANVATHPGIRIDTCSSGGSAAPSIVSVLPASSASLDTYLFFSSNIIIEGPTAGFQIVSPCTGTAPTFVNTNPLIFGGFYETSNNTLELRPSCTSPAYSAIDDVPDTSFYLAVGFKGAFGNNNWLAGWSYLSGRFTTATNPGGAASPCTGGATFLVAPPPPPPPPSPSPPIPENAVTEQQVSFQVTLGMTRDQFELVPVSTAYKNTVAARVGVSADKVALEVDDSVAGRRLQSASSIIVTNKIVVPDAASAATVSNSVQAIVAAPQAFTTSLQQSNPAFASVQVSGITAPVIATILVPNQIYVQPVAQEPQKVFPDWGIAVFVILAVVLGSLCALFYWVVRRERSGKPVFMQLDIKKKPSNPALDKGIELESTQV